MKTSNAELLAEIDTLEDIKRVDANELEVVKEIKKLQAENQLLKADKESAEEQIQSLFERVAGVSVSEYDSEQLLYLADMIEGQMDADNECIAKLKADKAELVEALSIMHMSIDDDLLCILNEDSLSKINELLERLS